MRFSLPKWRPFQSPLVFAIVVSLVLVALHNWRFWHETLAAATPSTVDDFLFLLSLFVILVMAHAGVLLLMPNARTMRVVAASAFLVAAATSFFIDSYNVVIDKEMIRNLLETDSQEASAFLVPRLGLYLLLLGLLPAVVALRARLVSPPLSRRLLQRVGFFTIAVVVSAGMTFRFFPYYTSFFSEDKTGALLNPAQPIAALAGYIASEVSRADNSFLDDPKSHGHSLREAAAGKPLLLFLVVGETARASNFQLGGYARPTNPELATTPELYYFDNVVSCGSSTAVSVPCIFSPKGHKASVSEARHRSNLLDALTSAGISVEWRENNSSSKGVALRVKNVNFLYEPQSAGCSGDACYDEDMISGLAAQLKGLRQNSVIVFHDLGSHGPAYWRRYPPTFETFKPVCRTSELWTCSQKALVNTYDNTILYTDHVLAQQIHLLESLSDVADSLLIYVSDHGESLGEHGLYLHGAPYALAPEEQIRVPLLIWTSEGYRQRFSVDDGCIKTELHRSLTHDNIYHTALGALGVRNAHYNQQLDLLGSCWGMQTDFRR
jgi:lipid A ethanolaminephosphotransferase